MYDLLFRSSGLRTELPVAFALTPPQCRWHRYNRERDRQYHAVQYIITSPRVYPTLQAEIDTAANENRISSSVVLDSEARALPYLQAVIREANRICPPGEGIMPKQVPPESDTINGVFLPLGIKVGVNMWAFQRSKEVLAMTWMCLGRRGG